MPAQRAEDLEAARRSGQHARMTRIQVRHLLQFALAALSLGVFALSWCGAVRLRLRAFLLSRFAWAPSNARCRAAARLALQAALLALALWLLPSLSPPAQAFFALAVGTVTGGIGITVAHELGHRASRLDRVLARMLLVSVGYGHFHVEHNRGHHVRVATPDDPASAPRGMHVYRFILRSVTGGFLHAWRLEAMRLGARGRSALHPSNWVLTGTLLWLGLCVPAPSGSRALSWSGRRRLVLELINSITDCSGTVWPAGALNRWRRITPGMPTSRSATGCCSICSCTRITMPMCSGRSKRCERCRRRRSCPPATRRWCWPRCCRRCGLP
ncbi:MAG: fatty acid desaturase [Burkholderiaceae bacterium]|nr:fatty acid desaturase [Burkholderiaceae bacterium]